MGLHRQIVLTSPSLTKLNVKTKIPQNQKLSGLNKSDTHR